MTPGTLFGLVLIGAGIFGLAVSDPLSKIATSSRAYLRPGLDRESYQRRNILQIRAIAVLWILLGVGCAIYGLTTGH
jgi:hypothetical protein